MLHAVIKIFFLICRLVVLATLKWDSIMDDSSSCIGMKPSRSSLIPSFNSSVVGILFLLGLRLHLSWS